MTDDRFEAMNWHDNYVHALRIVEGEWGSGKLILDIDHILEWRKTADGMRFLIAPAVLTFLEVSSLRLSLDYKAATAALGPFSLNTITRRSEDRGRYTAQIWTIEINWPKGEIEFEAAGFEQKIVGEALLCEEQHLPRPTRAEVRI